METKETTYCKNLLFLLSRADKVKLLENSNLNNRERDILILRVVDGLSVKESCNRLDIEEETFNKAQKKAYAKLFFFIQNKALISDLTNKLLINCL